MSDEYRILRIESAYLRREYNGLSIYDQDRDLYLFFENAAISSVINCPTMDSLYDTLREQGFSPSTSLQFRYPVRINWMVTGNCNLNCVYCIADNKMGRLSSGGNALGTAEHILSLHPLTVTLSGGEPTLCPELFRIIDHFAGKTSLILDTNGTLALTAQHIETLRQARVSVRISIDALSSEIVRMLRPCRSENYDYLSVIEANIRLLHAEHISFGIHSVITRHNLDELYAVGDWLENLGIRRWHLYGLLPNGRAKNCYSELRATDEEMEILTQELKERHPSMLISLSPQSDMHEATPALMVDCAGRFFVEPLRGTPLYIGSDPTRPTAEAIAGCLNVESYVKGYYGAALSERLVGGCMRVTVQTACPSTS